MKDHELRKRIRDEKFQARIPDSTAQKVDDILKQLPEESKSRKLGRIFRNAVVFATVLSISTVTVFAGAKLITLGRGTLSSSNGTKQYKRFVRSTEVKKNNGDVNISKTDKGLTLKIENIGLDEGNLLIYYTVTAKDIKNVTPQLSKTKKDDLRQRQKTNNIWLSPQIMINGKEDDQINETGITESYQVNDHQIKGIYRFNLSGRLKQKTQIKIITKYLWNKKGDWTITMNVDRSKISNKAKVIKVKNYKLADQIVLSPLGNTIRGEKDFVIRDDKGKYLYWVSKSYSEDTKKNITQFFTNQKNTKSLEIIPVKTQYVVKENGKVKKASIILKKGQKIKISNHMRLRVTDVKKQKHNLRVYFKVLDYDGSMVTDGYENHFVEDKNGKSLDKDYGNIAEWTDYEKGQLVLEFYNPSKGVDYTKAAKINFLKQNTILDEKNKQKIKLK